MKREMFAVFDAKSEMFSFPLTFQNDAVAVRTFATMANDPQSFICTNPEDYTLFHVGSFDEETAVVTQPATPRSLGLALQYKRSETPVESI